MYRFALLVVAVTLLTSSIAQAASYKKRNGTIVDPIMDIIGDVHGYSGPNLEPNTYLFEADLAYANLTNADLTGVSSGGIVGSPIALPTNWQLTGGYLIGPVSPPLRRSSRLSSRRPPLSLSDLALWQE